MSEKTYLKLQTALHQAKWEARRNWLAAWQIWPGAAPIQDSMAYYAQELQDINDAQAKLESLYYRSIGLVRGTSPELHQQHSDRNPK